MFDLSSDILIPNFDMLENNYNEMYNEFDSYDFNYEDPEFNLAQGHLPQSQLASNQSAYGAIDGFMSQPSFPYDQDSNHNLAQLQFSQGSQFTPGPTSSPVSSQYHSDLNEYNQFGYNQYSSHSTPLPQNLSSINVNLQQQQQQHMQAFGQAANVNLNDSFSTPSLTPQIQSPNFMYPQSYDMAAGNSYYDYKTQPPHSASSLQHTYNTQVQAGQSQSAPTLASFGNNDYYNAGALSSPNTLQVQTQMSTQVPGPSSMSSSVSTDSILKKGGSSPKDRKSNENKIITSNTNKYRVVRGIAAGGSSARPPKECINPDSVYLPIELNLVGGSVEDICKPSWSRAEKEDKRRIVRIERIQKANKIIANFSILGSANENPTVLPPPANSEIDVIEVSCLECSKKISEDDLNDDGDEYGSPQSDIDSEFDYYITSVEVIEIVELLIGTMNNNAGERRKERGRVRSNLVPYWSKKPISSRIDNNLQPDYRIELAKRIMSYEIRRPRGFDKEVRILKWNKLTSALKRALQCYYCEIPKSETLNF